MDEQNPPQIGRIIAKAWADEAFKARLIADPVATLRPEGVVVPEGVTVSVLEDSPTHRHLVLPAPAAEGEISYEALDRVVGGVKLLSNSANNDPHFDSAAVAASIMRP